MKLFLLLGFVPVLVAFVLRKFLSDSRVRKEGEVLLSFTGAEFVRRVLEKGRASSVELRVKSRPFLVIGPERLVLSPVLASSRRARDVAEAGLLAGMVLMARQQEKVMAWRMWAVKFGYAMPAFLVIVLCFAVVMGRLSVSLSLSLVVAALGLATLFLWLTLPVERAAARVVAEWLDESPLVSRRSEGEVLGGLVRAMAWRRVVPGAIAWIVGRP